LGWYNQPTQTQEVRVHYSFPINGHLKVYAEFFNGYGETLIDYNHYQSVGSIGFLLSTWH